MTAADKRPELASKVLSVFPDWYRRVYDVIATSDGVTVAEAARTVGIYESRVPKALYVFKRFGLVVKVKPEASGPYEVHYRVSTAAEIAGGGELAEEAKNWSHGTRDVYRFLRRCALDGFAPRVCDIQRAVAVSNPTVYRAMRVLHDAGLLIFHGGRGVRYSLNPGE